MTAEELRTIQAPFKERYRHDPDQARQVLRARVAVDPEALTCTPTPPRPAFSGLHPSAGGNSEGACAAETLLESLAACAGITLAVVATAMGIKLRGASIEVEGDLDFQGTLAIDRQVPVGFLAIRLKFDLDTEADPDQCAKLVALAERYCVVAQTLRRPSELSFSLQTREKTG